MTLRFGTGLTILALTAGAALAPACKVTVREGVPDDGGLSGAGGSGTGGTAGATGGTGGATGGTAGAGGSAGATGGAAGSAGSSGGAGGVDGGAGSAGTAGAATGGAAGASGAAGTGGTAGTDGGAACLGDDPVTSTVDGGATCSALPYAGAGLCTSGYNPYGLDLCLYFAAHARPGVLGTMVNCLALADATDPCGAVHDAAVTACLATLVATPKCSFPDIPADNDGGVLDCAGLAASCPADADAGTPGISEAECLGWVGLFDAATRADVVQCYNYAQPAKPTCREDFFECAQNVDGYPGDGQ